MAKMQLLEFYYDNKPVKVFTAESSSDVYYSMNGGRSISAGLNYNDNTGTFKSTSGASLKHKEAKSHILKKL